MELYLLPGMGCDTRIYRNLNIPGLELKLLEWPDPESCNGLPDLAKRIIHQNNIPKGSLIGGVSMGGMVSVEIGKILNSPKVLLISSSKTKYELPLYFRAVHHSGLLKVIPGRLIKAAYPVAEKLMGIRQKDGKSLFMDMLAGFDVENIRWALKAVLGWRNTEEPFDFLHLHGTSDLVIPFRKVRKAIPIENGTHFMVLDRASVISDLIESDLTG